MGGDRGLEPRCSKDEVGAVSTMPRAEDLVPGAHVIGDRPTGNDASADDGFCRRVSRGLGAIVQAESIAPEGDRTQENFAAIACGGSNANRHDALPLREPS